MIEKRRWPRVNCQWESIYNSLSRPGVGGMRTSSTIDVSEGGVRFRSSTFIAVGDKLRFTMRPPKNASMDTILSAVWVREVPHLQLFEIGGQFDDISSEGRLTIRETAREAESQFVNRTATPAL